MLQVSDAYKELVKSNIRPKCEPIIKVSGKDNNGNDIELIWRAKNIKNLTYKRSVDPVGRELPYMELTWTEVYTGKLNSDNSPEKYSNIINYMAVELSFVQDLGFHNTWKTIFNGGTKWKDLIGKTWKQVKNDVLQEVITFPKMFLSAKPTISGQTITWVAKDLLSFANERQTMAFGKKNSTDVMLRNVLSYFILNARGGFLNSLDLFYSFTKTVTDILSLEDGNMEKILVDEQIICDGNTNDIILNLASIYGYYLDFEDDIVKFRRFNPTSPTVKFDKKILYNYPKVESLPTISNYNFKYHIAEKNENNRYEKNPSEIINLGYIPSMAVNGFYVKYLFDKYGEAYMLSGNPLPSQAHISSYEEPYVSPDSNPQPDNILVIPINYNSYTGNILINNIGETFEENNPINPYDANWWQIENRTHFLSKYFYEGCSNIEFEALPNLGIQPNDTIIVDTNLWDNNGKQISKTALVASMEISYNGSIKQKIKAHEVKI